VNVVTLIGNLATDVDVLDLEQDRKRVTFRLAVGRRSSAGGADFFDVTVWDKEAAACERFLSKGKRIALDGRLRSRSWDAADGTKRYGVEVVANRVEFLWAPGESHSLESPDESAPPFGEVVPLAERSRA
jgi:single-strand DNA-binding protein